jgi:hypothetical protein
MSQCTSTYHGLQGCVCKSLAPGEGTIHLAYSHGSAHQDVEWYFSSVSQGISVVFWSHLASTSNVAIDGDDSPNLDSACVGSPMLCTYHSQLPESSATSECGYLQDQKGLSFSRSHQPNCVKSMLVSRLLTIRPQRSVCCSLIDCRQSIIHGCCAFRGCDDLARAYILVWRPSQRRAHRCWLES